MSLSHEGLTWPWDLAATAHLACTIYVSMCVVAHCFCMRCLQFWGVQNMQVVSAVQGAALEATSCRVVGALQAMCMPGAPFML